MEEKIGEEIKMKGKPKPTVIRGEASMNWIAIIYGILSGVVLYITGDILFIYKIPVVVIVLIVLAYLCFKNKYFQDKMIKLKEYLRKS